MTPHTPGPWRVGSNAFGGSLVTDEFGKGVLNPKRTRQEGVANLILMAAAPELLGALETAEQILASIHENGPCPELVNIRAALAKAKGEPQ